MKRVLVPSKNNDDNTVKIQSLNPLDDVLVIKRTGTAIGIIVKDQQSMMWRAMTGKPHFTNVMHAREDLIDLIRWLNYGDCEVYSVNC